MKRRTFIQSCAGGALALISRNNLLAQAADGITLERVFRNPPVSASAKSWWHWTSLHISADGITRDLEALKRVGIGGVQLFEQGQGIPKGPIDFGSPEHTQLWLHAIKEADRLGLEFDIHNCPGWSSSGGPWLNDRPELSMQVLTWTETTVAGGQRVALALRRPWAALNFYRDAMVLAFPAQPGEQAQTARIATNSGPLDTRTLDGNPETAVEIRPAGEGQSAYLQLEFAEPFEARSVSINNVATGAAAAGGGRGGPGGFGGAAGGGLSLEVSDDGAQFRGVAAVSGGMAFGREGMQLPALTNIPATRARFFRVVSTQARRVSELRLSGSGRVVNWSSKANFSSARGLGGMPGMASPAAVPIEQPGGPTIDPNTVVDISPSMNAQGQLDWQAPAGNWTIVRIGHTTTGAKCDPAPKGGTGLECDKFSKEALDFHFEHFFTKILGALAPLIAKSATGSIIDSYEMGMQNWTAQFPEMFQQRRGYDLKKYMPAMLGRVVGSPETTDKFLWDVRKTQAELMDENYYGRFQENLHAHGMKSFVEPYSPGNFDEMAAGARADVPMGELGLGTSNNASIKMASSVGHVYGRPVVAAESFTSQPKWQDYPYNMKTVGDFMYTQGIQQVIFHRCGHQPHPDVAPGMTMGPWGMYFDRTNTWFEHAAGWVGGYMRRTQAVLQQGQFVGDLLYFSGENSPVMPPTEAQLNPPLPPGYNWDTIDLDAIRSRVKIENGKIVLPDGMSYRVFVLGASTQISLALLRKLRDLVNQGMVLVGAKPAGSPSLADEDAEVRRIADELWGNVDGKTVTERAVGQGRVIWSQPLRAVLDKLGLKPDFEFAAKDADAPVHWIHRRTADADVYFVATRRRKAEELVCTFRVSGKQPEFWNTETGEIAKAAVFETVDGRTRVPLRLEPAGSMFVVFRSAPPARSIQLIAKDGAPLVVTEPFTAPTLGLHRNVTNNFTISVWIKPEMEGQMPRLGPAQPGSGMRGFGGGPSYVFYPIAGETAYGANHAACGLVASRNGVALYERSTGNPALVASAAAPVAGWTHVAVVYRDGTPALYLNGKAAGQAQKSGKVVHPGLGESFDAPIDFMGHNTEPQLINEALADDRIQQLAAAGLPAPPEPPACEAAGSARAELRYWQDGQYALRDNSGRTTEVRISGLGAPVEITGPWTVAFPPKLGAPPQITLPRLISLHRHSEEGVKYFSGTATYTKKFTVPAAARTAGKRLYLDLGRVEVIAEVKVNGKPAGNLWKPPYRVDITDVVRTGDNDLEIQVANLWPNRLIGDEEFPPEYEYGGPIDRFGTLEYFGGGAMKQIPEWYTKGQPRPQSARISFPLWKWYSKGDPLLESGLLGPVRLRVAINRTIDV